MLKAVQGQTISLVEEVFSGVERSLHSGAEEFSVWLNLKDVGAVSLYCLQADSEDSRA